MKRPSFQTQLRHAIKRCEISRYRICMEIGLSQSTMSRFMAGHCGLSAETIDKVFKLLELELRPARARKKE